MLHINETRTANAGNQNDHPTSERISSGSLSRKSGFLYAASGRAIFGHVVAFEEVSSIIYVERPYCIGEIDELRTESTQNKGK